MPVKIVLISKGVKALLHEPGVNARLEAGAKRVAATAGADMDDPEGMLAMEAGDENRARWIVVTANAEAIRGEALDRRLTRAIDAAR